MWPALFRFFGFGGNASVETRALDGAVVGDGWRGWGDFGYRSIAGPVVSRDSALSVPAIWSAIDTISKTMASLPFGVFQSTENGSKPATSHPAYYLTRLEPSPYQSSYSFRAALFAQACFGDAYAKIHRNGIGRPTQLELLDAENVTMMQDDGGTYYYVVRRTIGNRYTEEVLRYNEVLHIKGLTLNGVSGKPVTDIHRDSIGTSISAEQYGNYFFANGASPSGAIVFPMALDDKQRAIVERKFAQKQGGLQAVGKTIILDGGTKYEKMSLNPGEAMLNETRNFQVNQASRIFGVPVPLLAQLDNATLNNMETMGIQFVTLSLRPWAVQVEQEFARKLLTENERRSESYFFRFNFAALLRGDTKARAEYYKSALGGPSTGIGWMSVNEVRELENLDRIDDGDQVFTAEMLMEAQKQGNGQEMAQQEADDETETEQETDTNDDNNGTPQASN